MDTHLFLPEKAVSFFSQHRRPGLRPLLLAVAVGLALLAIPAVINFDPYLSRTGLAEERAALSRSAVHEVRRPASERPESQEQALTPGQLPEAPANPVSVDTKTEPTPRVAPKRETTALSRPAMSPERVELGSPRAEVLRALGDPLEVRQGRGRDFYEGFRYAGGWVVMKNGAVQCLRSRLEYSPRYGSDVHCAGFADSILKF